MHPELLRIGSLTINSYGLMMALGFIAAGVLAAWGFKRRGLNPDSAIIGLMAAMVGGLVGAKLHYLIINPGSFPEAVFSGRGLVWYGGLLGGTLGVILALRWQKVPIGPAADAVAPGLAAGYAFGRIGCLLNGCCHGSETSLPWGMVFPVGSPPTSVPVHPTQLYESLTSLLILGVLLFLLQPRLRRTGALFWAYVALAGLERLLVEFLRINRPVWLGLTQQQLISVGMIVAGLVGVIWLYRRGAEVEPVSLRSAGETHGAAGAGLRGGAVAGRKAGANTAGARTRGGGAVGSAGKRS
mgnify:CR=1 FL=1